VIDVTCVPASSAAPSKQGSKPAVAQVTILQPVTASYGSSTAMTRRPVRSLQVRAKSRRCSGVGL
jgi:hypothetical protein